MSPHEFRMSRRKLGLSSKQMAILLGYREGNSVRQFETTGSSHREPGDRVLRLMAAYLSGYRPADWPPRKRVLVPRI